MNPLFKRIHPDLFGSYSLEIRNTNSSAVQTINHLIESCRVILDDGIPVRENVNSSYNIIFFMLPNKSSDTIEKKSFLLSFPNYLNNPLTYSTPHLKQSAKRSIRNEFHRLLSSCNIDVPWSIQNVSHPTNRPTKTERAKSTYKDSIWQTDDTDFDFSAIKSQKTRENQEQAADPRYYVKEDDVSDVLYEVGMSGDFDLEDFIDPDAYDSILEANEMPKRIRDDIRMKPLKNIPTSELIFESSVTCMKEKKKQFFRHTNNSRTVILPSTRGLTRDFVKSNIKVVNMKDKTRYQAISKAEEDEARNRISSLIERHKKGIAFDKSWKDCVTFLLHGGKEMSVNRSLHHDKKNHYTIMTPINFDERTLVGLLNVMNKK